MLPGAPAGAGIIGDELPPIPLEPDVPDSVPVVPAGGLAGDGLAPVGAESEALEPVPDVPDAPDEPCGQLALVLPGGQSAALPDEPVLEVSEAPLLPEPIMPAPAGDDAPEEP